MFGLLKKKISSFIGSLTKKEEEKGEPQDDGQAPAIPAEPAPEKQVEAERQKPGQTEQKPQPPVQPKPPEPVSPAAPIAQKQPETTTPKPPQTKPAPSSAQAGKPLEPDVKPPAAPKPTPDTKPVASTAATPKPESQPEHPRPAPKAEPVPQEKPVQPPVSKPETAQPSQTPLAQAPPVPSANPTPQQSEPVPEKQATKKPGFLDALLGRKPKAEPQQAKPVEPVKAPTPAVAPTQSVSEPTAPSKTPPKAPEIPEEQAEPRQRPTAIPVPEPVSAEPKKERKLEAKLGILSQVKGFFVKDVTIQENELEPMLEELNLALLESDVTLDTAEYITNTLKTQLSGKKIQKTQLQAEIQSAVKTVLTSLVGQHPLDVAEHVRSHEKPVKILFLGPNGAGKTTTIAKIAFHLKNNGISCVLAAGDTFRAAAIEQLSHHGEKIGVTVIHHQYGSDPSAVAFDAIAHATARKIDCVLIDTAGRQETNLNLLKEMEKINRVVKPDLKL
ncbi:MAG: signal recognition particle receptor subunit alpha, partial [Candidatus Micrarchaeota archaeon]|nr:signal recognition particle receptor subunit alpha [Candidatus Micrarchaeota archaeon]